MIAHYPKSREYAIMRVSEDDAQWLSSKDEWTREQKRAKRFYHKDSAEWALVLAKIQWKRKEEDSTSKDQVVSTDKLRRRCWSSFPY
jgi:hypothetical protein